MVPDMVEPTAEIEALLYRKCRDLVEVKNLFEQIFLSSNINKERNTAVRRRESFRPADGMEAGLTGEYEKERKTDNASVTEMAASGTGFTFLMTTLGAAMVFLFRRRISEKVQKIFLGFARGRHDRGFRLVPSDSCHRQGGGGGTDRLDPCGPAVLRWGSCFLLLMDQLLPHLHVGEEEPEGIGTSWKRTTLLVMAVTLHNIPEGMAVGLSFALAAQEAGAGAGLTGGFCPGAGNRHPEFSRKGRPFPFLCGRKGFRRGRRF